jgi:acyl-CoA reductase-like NAD-dependent aldehyde dehydrogenase
MLQVVQAFDRVPIAEVPIDDGASREAKLDPATRAFRDRNRWLKPYERIAVLRRVAGLMEERRALFMDLITLEGAKPLSDVAVEVERTIDGVRNAAQELRGFAGREIPMGLNAASAGRWAFTTKERIGIAVSISAFNHPLNLIVHQVVPAIAVGCPVIVKPATATPLCCLEYVALLWEAGLAEPWCQSFVTSDNALAEQMATDPRIAFVSFIGLARVGWHLRSRLAPGTRCALEHGGTALAVIDRSADLDQVIGPMVKGGRYHACQVWVSTQQIFVHADIQTEFVGRFAAKVSTLRVGDPLEPSVDVGPLIHPREPEHVAAWVDEAIKGGARLIGGGRASETILYPAILVEPPSDAKVSREEVFGPLTCVYGFTELDAAIEAANSLPVAFQASIFSSEIGPALLAAERLDASAVMVDDDHTAFRRLDAFTGRRRSGHGVGGNPWSMHELAEHKMLILRHV